MKVDMTSEYAGMKVDMIMTFLAYIVDPSTFHCCQLSQLSLQVFV